MEFPKTFLFGIFCLVALVTADLNDDKKAAIKEMDNKVKEMKRYLKIYLDQLELREYYLEEVIVSVRRLGFEIWEDSDFLINKSASTSTIMANLMKCSQDVFSCIKKREIEGVDANYKYYSEKISSPIEEIGLSAKAHQRDIISKWRNDCDRAFLENSKLFEKSEKEIQKANDGATISSIVKNFINETQKIADLIESIFSNINKFAVETHQKLTPFLDTYKKYVLPLVKETVTAIKKCVPKS